MIKCQTCKLIVGRDNETAWSLHHLITLSLYHLFVPIYSRIPEGVWIFHCGDPGILRTIIFNDTPDQGILTNPSARTSH